MHVEDWESRRPCPDGRCTGVLDDGGTCGTCGRKSAGGTATSTPDGQPSTPVEESIASGDGEALAGDEPPAADDEWAERRPCPDGACTGVLGETGICGTCGRKG